MISREVSFFPDALARRWDIQTKEDSVSHGHDPHHDAEGRRTRA